MAVTCSIQDDPSRAEVIGINGRLVVLDENDNVMVWGEDSLSDVTIFISLADHEFNMKEVS